MKTGKDNSSRMEIFCFCLGPSEGEYAYGTLDGRMVAQQELSTVHDTVELGGKIVSIIWDPLGKYICALTITNHLMVYNLNSKKIENTVKLSIRSENAELFVNKEERKMDFSPDMSYLLVPSLDDKRMPFVCALNRSRNFQVDYVFAGPFSSITCLKFCPLIFQKSGAYFTAFAMGDAFGQISLWELSDKKVKESPLLLLKNDDTNLTIGNIDFQKGGQFCVASTDKRSLMVVYFDLDFETHIGPKVPVDKYLQEHYGAVRPGAKEFMKTYRDLQKPKQVSKIEEEKKESVPEEPKKIIKHYKKGKRVDAAQEVQPEDENKAIGGSESKQTSKEEPATFMKNLSSDEPSGLKRSTDKERERMIIEESEQHNQKSAKFQESVASAVRDIELRDKSYLPSISKIPESGSISLNRLSVDKDTIQVLYRVQGLEGNQTQVMIKDQWETVVEGVAQHIEASETYLVIYTSRGFLYILWLESGRRAELPLKLDSLSKMNINQNGHLLTLDTTGKLKIIDLKKKLLKLQTDIRGLMIGHYLGSKVKKLESSDWFKEHQNEFQIFLNKHGDPLLKLDMITYLVYNPAYHCWAAAPDEYLLSSFDLESNQVTESSKLISRNLFFEQEARGVFSQKLNKTFSESPELSDIVVSKSDIRTSTGSLAKLEESLLCSIRSDDRAAFNEHLKNYIIELASRKQFEKLKSFLLVTLLTENGSKERQFLDKLGVKPEVILANSIKILEKVDYCRGVVEEIRQAVELFKLEK